MHEKVKYKLSRCFVPSCKNRPSAAGTSKLFFPVPKGEERNEWIRSCGRKSTSLVTTHIICEDHFTLEDDVTGYHSFITAVRLGCPPPCKPKLKKGILPTKFGQDEANLSSSTISLTASSIKTETSPSNFQDPSPYNDAFPSPLADALDHRLNPEIESPSSLMNISPIQLTSSNNVMSGLSFESCNEIYPTNEATHSSHTSTETHYFTPSNTPGQHSEKRNTPAERDKSLPNGKVLKIEVEPDLSYLERDEPLQNGEFLKIKVEPDLTYLERDEPLQNGEVLKIKVEPDRTYLERDEPLLNGEVLKIKVEPDLTYLERDETLLNGEVLKINLEPDLTYLADLENLSDPAREEKPSRVTTLSQVPPGNGCAYCGCCCRTKPRGIDVGVQVSQQAGSSSPFDTA